MKNPISLPQSWSKRQRTLIWLALPVIAIALSFAAGSQSSPPNVKAIALASDPLYATTSGDKPALALALSVEYPTVGAQYTTAYGAVDTTYANTNEYLGYYDSESCYVYNNAPTETPAAGLTKADYKRFDRSGKATARMCADAFSGNFLNWASSSAIDMLRLALSGGDRYIDEDGLTILQRAVIPNGNPICMWNSSNFPAKRLQKSGGASATAYWGAVPQQMVAAAGANDIFVANTLNQIFFGTSQGGGCGNTASYNLSKIPATTGHGTPVFTNGALPGDASASCANENGTCSFTGNREVWYGANNNWSVAPAANGIGCDNTTFGDPIVGTAKQCYTRATTWTPSTGSGSGLNSDGFFYSRVQVCDKVGPDLGDQRDYKFCTKYPSGNFKPTGAVQKYSDQLRLAAFGYLLDQRNGEAVNDPNVQLGHFGGVLRAPMKYVGPKTYDINGVENTPTGGNPKVEWSAQTGIYTPNPENDTTFPVSGVINYLNKFGRTGTPGIYKIYDPVSELYYETLRYMQGLQPSPLAVDSITTGMYDGFPAYSTWTDPYGDGRPANGAYACLKSNIVVIGDVNTHDGNRYPGVNMAANIPDVSAWTSVVGNFERGNVANYFDGQGVLRQTGNPNTPNGSPRGDAIIGYSYWAHTHDIRGTTWTNEPTKQRPGLRVKTFIFDVNEYGNGTDDDTRRYRNQFFTAAKYGGFEADPANGVGAPFNTFGNPFKQQDGTVNNNVWQKPADPGEASSYYLQSSARGVLNAFDEIFSRASTSARSIAGGAIQSKALTQAGSHIYQGAFDTSNWSGDLFALPITVDTSNNVTLSTEADWSAATRLSLLAAPATSRNIVVGVPNAGATPFLWDNNLPAALKTDLNRLSPTAAADNLGSDRVAYLRGSNVKEGALFRARNNKLLGDIINSGVVYSGAPATNINSTTYAAFRDSLISKPAAGTTPAVVGRTPAVFVGANDGMLHAFNADTGDELFGYIPSWLGPKLSALTSPDYLANHQSYVDGPPVVAEAQVRSQGTSDDWATVLVSGTGAGGRGVFALDVTRPENFSASKVMWEFTQNDDPDMGFVVGQPAILKFRTSAPTATVATYKWYAVVASGVNNYTTANDAGVYGSGQPGLFLLDLNHTVGTAWTLGTDYYKISLPVDSSLAATNATGVLNFKAALSTGGTQEVMHIYAGDLHGNMWKLDFNKHGATEWSMSTLSGFSSSGIPIPLYTAKDGAGNVQPISMAPGLIASASNPQGIQVAFGTGKYLEVSDRSSTAQNSFYVVYDNGTTTADSASDVINGRGRLAAGTINTTTNAITVPTFVWGRPTSDTDVTQRAGWYVDYTASGERQISGLTLFGSQLVFGSLIPGTAGDATACGVSGGSGYQYRLDVDSGNGDRRLSQIGILGQPLVLELASAAYTVSDSTGRRKKTITSQVIDQGSGGLSTAAGSAGQTTKTITAGRLSWRQINNYQSLKSAP